MELMNPCDIKRNPLCFLGIHNWAISPGKLSATFYTYIRTCSRCLEMQSCCSLYSNEYTLGNYESTRWDHLKTPKEVKREKARVRDNQSRIESLPEIQKMIMRSIND